MKTFAVISHTHWDREWYFPLEIFRMKLVDLIDHCLLTLEKYPTYIFHLDAQTIILEDYLLVRTQKRNILKNYISEGRLCVGPWYVQNDFYLTSGESTVRNLLIGTKIAEEFGFCTKVGYAPDQFGNISQLPQIFMNFGINNFLFGRGLTKFQIDENGNRNRLQPPSEFYWMGSDGSKILAIHMPFWYNNAQRFSENIEVAKLLVEMTEKNFTNIASTPFLLMMNGVDHLEIQDNLLPILDNLNSGFTDKIITQYKMDNYIDDVQNYIAINNLDLWTHEGQLHMGSDGELLKGTLSSRNYLKIANVKAQNMIENQLEPLYSMLTISGFKNSYPHDYLEYLWKELIKNHPHDSICGCSCDKVHQHMEDNFSRLFESCDELLRKGMFLAAEHMITKCMHKDDYLIIVANTIELEFTGFVRVTLDFPIAENIECFEIFDMKNNPIEFSIISKEHTIKDLFTPLNLPGAIDITRYEIYLKLNNVSGFSFNSYNVKKQDSIKANISVSNNRLIYSANDESSYRFKNDELKLQSHNHFINSKTPDDFVLENEHLSITISQNGLVNLLNKETGILCTNILDFEETADRGDSYIYFKTDDSPIIASTFDADVSIIEFNDFSKRCRIVRNMIVPADYDFVCLSRSKEMVTCVIEIILSLEYNSKFLLVEYVINNKAKCHRIRALVNTNIISHESIADIPFDIIRNNDFSHFPGTMSRVLPNTSFALIENDVYGMAVLTEGTHEYEHMSDNSTLAFTLVRSTGVICRDGATIKAVGGKQWECPENQCIREMKGRFAIMPFTGNHITANIPRSAKSFRNPPLPYFTSCDNKKFAAGRSAVQDSGLEECFHLPDPYENITINNNTSFITVEGDGIVITAIKQTEDLKSIIVRFVNLNDIEVNASIKIKGTIYLTNMSEESENLLGSDMINHIITPKKIVTLKVDFD